MNGIYRIWVYKEGYEGLKYPECKPSSTNKTVQRNTVGYFKYFVIEGEQATPSCRREADKWFQETGHTIETLRGYPAFMHDAGYRP